MSDPSEHGFDLHHIHEPRIPEFSQAILDGMVRGCDKPAQAGFTDEQKQAASVAIADGFEALRIKRDDLLFVILEVHGAAWHAPERVEA